MSNSNFENNPIQKTYRSNNYERSNFKGRTGNNRDVGGFRIRLSDNEMKAVKNIQDAYQLKSAVAVLGFSLRTLSEMLNDTELRESINKFAQNNKNSSSKSGTENSFKQCDKNEVPDPFARPEKAKPIDSKKDDIDNGDEK